MNKTTSSETKKEYSSYEEWANDFLVDGYNVELDDSTSKSLSDILRAEIKRQEAKANKLAGTSSGQTHKIKA